uniref:Uncharacterized protein n=1 Tax=Sphenodon punctatus TaxID=8508 RepID=A0A8D0GII5_SPHPU
MALSGSVLALTFWPVIRSDTKLVAFTTLAAILALHALLAVGCKLYFFQQPSSIPSPTLLHPTAAQMVKLPGGTNATQHVKSSR